MFLLLFLIYKAISTSPEFTMMSKIIGYYDSVISAIENHTKSLNENNNQEISFDEVDFTLERVKVPRKSLKETLSWLRKRVVNVILENDETSRKMDCKNCIFIKSQNASMLFNTKSKSIATGIYFKYITKNSCKINKFMIKFFNDNKIIMETKNFTINSRKNVYFDFDYSITFNSFEIFATSDDNSMMCINDFKLEYREPKQAAISN